MTLRAVFIADGPSDLPIAGHLELLCAEHGREVQVTAIDPRNIRFGDRTVEGRLRFLVAHDVDPDLIFVHRDAESADVGERVAEVRAAVEAAGIEPQRAVAVVPVRMTKAWLLIDEREIRRVAGRPNGTNPLGLPPLARVEDVADPKMLLRDLLLEAGQPAGRRRRERFHRDFGQHRALLLQRLDPGGPINQLPAWQRLRADIARALSHGPEGEL